MARRRVRRGKEDTFPYIVLAGICIVALIAVLVTRPAGVEKVGNDDNLLGQAGGIGAYEPLAPTTLALTWTQVQMTGVDGYVNIDSDADGTNFIVAGEYGRIHTSSDSGTTWTQRQPAGNTDQYWSGVASDSDGTHLIAAFSYGPGDTSGRIYTSSDSGTTWTQRQPAGNNNRYWKAVASDSDGTHLIAASQGDVGGRIYTSSDSGTTWTERRPAGNTDHYWSGVASDSDGTHLIAAAHSGRVYTSSDSGATWTERRPGGNIEQDWVGVASDSDGTHLIVASQAVETSTGARLYTSSDSGTTWTQRQPTGNTDNRWRAVASDSDGTHLIAIDFSGDMFTSSDGGTTWTQQEAGGHIVAIASSADGAKIFGADSDGHLYISSSTPHVFIDDLDIANKNELYSENTATGVVTKISGPLPDDEDVASFNVTSDGQRVVYRAGKQMAEGSFTGGNWQVYSVPSNGGTAVRINGPMQAQGGVTAFKIAPNNQRVVYSADGTVNAAVELYSVPITGGTAVSISGPMRTYFDSPNVISSNVISFFIAPDSQRVVYTADMETWTMYEVYSVPIAGGTAARISHTLPEDHDVEGIVIAPNGQRVVYRAVRTSLGKGELYSVPITGGTAVRISQAHNPPTSTIEIKFDMNGLGAVVSCNSQSVYYLADTHADNQADELYSVPITGGTITPLSGSVLPTLNCSAPPPACSPAGSACSENANCCSTNCTVGVCVAPPVVTNTPPGYAPATDPIDGQTYLSAASGAQGVSMTANGGNGRYVWRFGYYFANSQWNHFEITGAGVAGTNWTNTTHNLLLPSAAPASGYIIIFACKKYPGRDGYICGPRTATQTASDPFWTIVEYTAPGGGNGCTDECAIGATICSAAAGTVLSCGNYDADTCREWGNPTTCPTGTTCSNGACTTGGGGGGTYCGSIDRAACSASNVAGATQISAYCPPCQISPCPPTMPDQHCYQCPVGQEPVYNSATDTRSCVGENGGGGEDGDPCDSIPRSVCDINPVLNGGVAHTELGCLQQAGNTNVCYQCPVGTVPEYDSTTHRTSCVTDTSGPCTPECTEGELECGPAGVRECVTDADADTCTEWNTVTPCPSGQCASATTCAPAGDPPACPIWNRRCNEANTAVEVCMTSSGVLGWYQELACTSATCTEPTSTSAVCDTGGCPEGTSNAMWMAGGYGACSPMLGSCWDGSHRTQVGTEAICVDEETECVVSTLRRSVGDNPWTNDQNYDFICGDKGHGPTWFVCDDSHRDQTFQVGAASWCCTVNHRFESGACP